MQQFRGGLLCKAHSLCCHSTLGLRRIQQKWKFRLSTPNAKRKCLEPFLVFRVFLNRPLFSRSSTNRVQLCLALLQPQLQTVRVETLSPKRHAGCIPCVRCVSQTTRSRSCGTTSPSSPSSRYRAASLIRNRLPPRTFPTPPGTPSPHSQIISKRTLDCAFTPVPYPESV